MTVRRAFGALITFIALLVVAFAAIALLRPVWLQGLYAATYDLYSVGPLPSISAAGEPRASRAVSLPPASGEPIGVLEIPRLGLSTVVIEGDETAALLLGVGHLADTPLPWATGNSVLAAHRDTFFRPLEGIRRDDVIRFASDGGDLEYVVRNTRIVEPTEVEVLAPTSSSILTLITCYPFNYIGPAPMRFVVTAERVS
jgi:sortase A